MSLRPVTRRLAAVAAALCLFAVVAPIQAAVVASFDPPFGPAIPNLGFRGSITLDVPTACYQLGSGFHYTGGACDITVQSAVVNFYNATTSSGNLSSVPLAGGFFASNYVYGYYIDGVTGLLTGFDTNLSDRFAVSVNDSTSGAMIDYNDTMLLYFVSGTAVGIGRASEMTTDAVFIPPPSQRPGLGGAFLRECRSSSEDCNGADSLPGTLTFTDTDVAAVPEPDSVALALVGLSALVVGRRRKSVAR